MPIDIYRCSNPNCVKGANHTFSLQRALSVHCYRNNACRAYNESENAKPKSSYKPTVELESAKNSHESLFSLNLGEDSSVPSDIENNSLVPSPSEVKMTDPNFIFSMKQAYIVKLMKLLDDMNCPDYALPSILKWVCDVQDYNHNFDSTPRNRDANITWMRNMLKNSNYLLPVSVSIEIPPSKEMDVVFFDFVPQLLSLIQDSKKMVQENLVIDVTNPTSLPKRSLNKAIGEVIDGFAYRESYKVAQMR